LFCPVFCHHGPVNAARNLPAGKILVIDDNPVVPSALSPALKSGGYQVFEAGDVPAAFHLARRIRPDLIVLDIFFPPDVSQSGNSWDAFMIIEWFQRMGVVGDTPSLSFPARNRKKRGRSTGKNFRGPGP
jgi:CheY-like chemotaxis protein